MLLLGCWPMQSTAQLSKRASFPQSWHMHMWSYQACSCNPTHQSLAAQVVQQRAARQQQADDEDRVAQELHRQGVERDRHIKSLQKLHAENAELRDLQSGILAAQVRTGWGVLRLCMSAGTL